MRYTENINARLDEFKEWELSEHAGKFVARSPDEAVAICYAKDLRDLICKLDLADIRLADVVTATVNPFGINQECREIVDA